jgi:aminopeptidase N
MQWFDDVWLKEVFAGFMADKIVQPQFPDIDHQLQFLLTHYPRAYAVDRSQGTHPIKQELENMNLAGTLYGAIIYNKAPIVFQQLEWLMGQEAFKLAVREYLETFSYNNSDWNDLAEIFDRYSTLDLKGWSQAWIYGQGRPTITFEYLYDKGSLSGVKLFSLSSQNIEHFPAQNLNPAMLSFSDQPLTAGKNWFYDTSPQVFELHEASAQPKMLLLNGGGAGYGYMAPDLSTRRFLLEELPLGPDNYLKTAGFVNLHEDFLEGHITPESYIQALATAISGSKNPQIIRYLLGNLQLVYWRFISETEQKQFSQPLETMLWEKLVEAPADQKALLLDAFIGMAISRQALVKIEQLLSNQLSVWGLKVSEEQRFSMVAALLLNERPRAKAFSEHLLATTTNPDRLRRLEFILPALSDDQLVRDHFFESLAKPANRRPEPWVIEALNYLNHPLRAQASLKYLPKSLKMLEEIQQTGDIFFPLNWLEANLWGHCSPEAAKIVDDFLNDPEFTNVNLKLKTLQAADLLFRAAQRRRI